MAKERSTPALAPAPSASAAHSTAPASTVVYVYTVTKNEHIELASGEAYIDTRILATYKSDIEAVKDAREAIQMLDSKRHGYATEPRKYHLNEVCKRDKHGYLTRWRVFREDGDFIQVERHVLHGA